MQPYVEAQPTPGSPFEPVAKLVMGQEPAQKTPPTLSTTDTEQEPLLEPQVEPETSLK